ncbi:MAG: toluene hydroxylase [Pyrobaculum sp.]
MPNLEPKEPRLPTRDEFYDLANKFEWTPKYVSEEELFPVDMHGLPYLPIDVWAETYDAPYKVLYREYVKNQRSKDQMVFAVRDAAARAELDRKLDPVYHGGAFCFHITAIPIPEYTAVVGEGRMARFGKSGEWRNLATFGMMDETRHAQLQILLAHDKIGINPKFAFGHKLFWVDGWVSVFARKFFDDIITAADAVENALMLTFGFGVHKLAIHRLRRHGQQGRRFHVRKHHRKHTDRRVSPRADRPPCSEDVRRYCEAKF